MKIGIIECGPVPAALRNTYISYPAMFSAQLAPLLPLATFETVSVVHGEALPGPEARDAWLLTGSRHGVYDDLPWIEPLKTFIRAVAAQRRPMVGVCFGHQIIAEALGGRVQKAEIGWRVGLETYATRFNGAAQSVAMPAFHQDQIVVQPPGTEIVAQSDACPYAGLSYTDAPILSVQFHPEFNRPYLADLIACLSKQGAEPGLPPQAETGDVADDTGMRWIADFLAGR
ncbi:type 1 glutamine amidotransferase [Ferrovibrio sp.]|uniref:type 1 glutamine amidotransferase n=1 Tax=Ferrovibrio sp. TaxID=1917215 RepID=UPI00261A64B1|nr:type 1 glutamine amidotransferase [Ferrovibrio sp.]